MGKVLCIATREKTRAVMKTCTAAEISFEQGVGNDSRGRKQNHRQVTILTLEGWNEACEELGTELDWTTRRANILVEGIDLKETTGKFLKIGNFKLEVTGELVPCNRMDEQHDGLTKALSVNWRGGVTCTLISEGKIAENDAIDFSTKV
jgi:MOSC domain-containing protein YiiM